MRDWTLGVLVVIAGCGTSGQNPTGIVQVKGKAVGANGQPIRHVGLMFYPTRPGGTTASATVGADGAFVPKTLNNQDGIIPGNYPRCRQDLPQSGSDEGGAEVRRRRIVSTWSSRCPPGRRR